MEIDISPKEEARRAEILLRWFDAIWNEAMETAAQLMKEEHRTKAAIKYADSKRPSVRQFDQAGGTPS